MNYIELFAGIGGFRNGIGDSGKCVWANEWDKYAAAVYRYRYGDICESDIRTIKPSEIPSHDLICAGFPCQTFSIVGKRAGFKDTRGTLFYEICEIARVKGTKYLFLENVKGLLNHEGGVTFQTIISTLDELGYDCQWQVLDSYDFGVPQQRERIYIIANLRTERRPQVFPLSVQNQERKISGINTERDDVVWVADFRNDEGLRIKNDKTFYTLKAQARQDGAAGQNIIKLTDGTIRRLTPIECERLQNFPDNWTKYGMDKIGRRITIPDTQRYKLIGNSATTTIPQMAYRKLAEVHNEIH